MTRKIMMLLFLVLCSMAQQMSQEKKRVKIYKVTAISPIEKRLYSGVVESAKTVDLAFQVGGKVVFIASKKGQFFKKGKLIAQIDATDYDQKVKSAKSVFEKASKDFKRFSALQEIGAVTKSQFELKQTDFENAKTAYKLALSQKQYTKLLAPFDGELGDIYVDKFQIVDPGTSIATFFNDKKIKLAVLISGRQLLTKDQFDIMHLTARFVGLDKVFKLKILEFSTIKDPTTQMYKAYTVIDEDSSKYRLLPGMNAIIEAQAIPKNKDPYVLVPKYAIFANNQKQSFVYKIVHDKAVKTPIEIRRITSKGIWVKGLAVGDEVVAAGVSYLKDGAFVEPQTIIEE